MAIILPGGHIEENDLCLFIGVPKIAVVGVWVIALAFGYFRQTGRIANALGIFCVVFSSVSLTVIALETFFAPSISTLRTRGKKRI